MKSKEKRAEVEVLYRLEFSKQTFEFGVATNEQERAEVRAQRFRVYKAHGYYKNPPETYESKHPYDYDEYDEKAIYFVGRLDDGTIVGSARLVIGKEGIPFPVQKAFCFEDPEEIRDVPIGHRAEAGKFVSERTQRLDFGKLITTIELIEAILNYSRKRGLLCEFAFIKRRLLGGLKAAGFPFHEISGARTIYPHDGIMADYFYSHPDPVIPVYYFRDEMALKIRNAVEALPDLRKLVSFS